MLFVENRNDFDHTDRFNGVDYVFPKGEKVPVEEPAAQHFFGWGLMDKTEALLRQGWANRVDGLQKLKKFVFTPAMLVEQPTLPAAQVAANAAAALGTDQGEAKPESKSLLDNVSMKKRS